MIICLIEFKTLPGMESQQQQWLDDLMPIVDKMPGFQGKESYSHISGDGRISTVSYWEDENALMAWTRDPQHQEAMKDGRERIFSHYEIRICSQLRYYEHTREN